MRNRPFFWVCLGLSLLLMGIAAVGKGEYLTDFPPCSLQGGEDVTLLGKVGQKIQKDNYQIFYLNQNRLFYGQYSLQESRIIVYISSYGKPFQEGQEEIPIGAWLRVGGELVLPSQARNPGNFDQKQYYRTQGIRYILYADSYEEIPVGKRCVYDRLREILYQFRRRWQTLLEKEAGGKSGGVFAAILLGEKSGLDAELKEIYQKNGFGHILAISGLHLSFVGMGIYRFFRKLTGSYLAAAVVGTVFLGLYILMIGWSVSVLRALVMFLFRAGADVAGRKNDGFTAFSAALLAVLIWRPLSVYDGGFWLSFGAVLGILLVVPVFSDAAGGLWEEKESRRLPGEPPAPGWKSSFREKARHARDALLQGFLASAGIQLVTMPVLLYFFFEIPVYGVFLNLLVLPLLSVLLASGFLGSFLLAARIPFGTLFFKAAQVIFWIYETIGKGTLCLPFARWVAGKPELWKIGLYYFLLAVLLALWKCQIVRSRRFLLLGVSLLISVVGIRFGQIGVAQVTMLDVGQGDSIFLRSADGTAYLMDGGSSDVKQVGQYRIEPFLKSEGAGTLDYVFVSHGDSDHLCGIKEMIERMQDGVGITIRTLALPEQKFWDEKLEALAGLAKEAGIRVAVMKKGQTVGKAGTMAITCLAPDSGSTLEPGNEASLVLAVQCGGFDLLLTGDVEGDGEEALTATLRQEYAKTSWEVLKAAHHGSKYSSSEDFLSIVRPKAAWISAGMDNPYGHPHEETLKRLRKYKATVRQTAEDGAIAVKFKP